ncbi:MAG: acyl-CoA dehydratase activase [Oscillospiraceae bacterium]|jgi:predicted CoA-substrate-specific enzyme activase|nr:acyl-CoA dehydratase activase [Oscillospiraceae bacterium]
MFFCGCDVGSTYGKCVIMDEGGALAGRGMIRSKLDPEDTAREVIALAAGDAGLEGEKPFAYLVGTGYGRDLVPFADANISEISCHAMGVHVLAPSVRTIVDFGGQDLKGISVDENGMVSNFVMNDKCAAGTGRFFEAMARAFSMDIEQFSKLSLDAKEEISITSQCSVFAETEVISMIARKKRPEDIALGIEASVARRAYALLRNTGIRPDVAVTGGCSKNKGLIQCLKDTFNLTFVDLPEDPQFAGAIGAAEYARVRGIKKGAKHG